MRVQPAGLQAPRPTGVVLACPTSVRGEAWPWQLGTPGNQSATSGIGPTTDACEHESAILGTSEADTGPRRATVADLLVAMQNCCSAVSVDTCYCAPLSSMETLSEAARVYHASYRCDLAGRHFGTT